MLDLIGHSTRLPHTPDAKTHTVGEWLGLTGTHSRGVDSSRAEMVGHLIAWTVTPGCKCDDCLDRIDMAIRATRMTEVEVDDVLGKVKM